MRFNQSLWPVFAASTLLLAGCGGGGSSSATSAVAVGAWGSQSQQIQFTVTSTGAVITTGSSNGVIAKPLTADDKGNFDATGTYTPSPGVGPPPPPSGSSTGTSTIASPIYMAHYLGTITSNSMKLTIVVSGDPISGGPGVNYGTGTTTYSPYTLTYGTVVTIYPPA